MALQINWGILNGAPDAGAAFSQGYQVARKARQEQATQDALAGYGATGQVSPALWALDPQAAALASRNSREVDALARTSRANHNYATYLRQNPVDALAPAPAAVAPGGGAATTDANGDIVVQARPSQPAPPQRTISIADIAEDDPEVARQLSQHMAGLSKEHREDLADHFAAAASVAAQAKALPVSERQAFINQHRDYLSLYGWTDAQIAAADTSDAGLGGLIALGMGADKYLDNLRSDRSEGRQEYYRARADARAGRSEARAERADRRAAVRFSERDKDRAALAGSFGIPSDTSDLDY